MNIWGHRFFQNPNQKLQRFLPYPLVNFQGRNLCNFWLGFWKKQYEILTCKLRKSKLWPQEWKQLQWCQPLFLHLSLLFHMGLWKMLDVGHILSPHRLDDWVKIATCNIFLTLNDFQQKLPHSSHILNSLLGLSKRQHIGEFHS